MELQITNTTTNVGCSNRIGSKYDVKFIDSDDRVINVGNKKLKIETYV